MEATSSETLNANVREESKDLTTKFDMMQTTTEVVIEPKNEGMYNK